MLDPEAESVCVEVDRPSHVGDLIADAMETEHCHGCDCTTGASRGTLIHVRRLLRRADDPGGNQQAAAKIVSLRRSPRWSAERLGPFERPSDVARVDVAASSAQRDERGVDRETFVHDSA